MTGLDVLARGADTFGVRLGASQLNQFETYLDCLRQSNARANLTSESALADAERVHFLDSLSLIPLIRNSATVPECLVDVGSGAGFPGLVLKLALPDLEVVLVEVNRKKVEFLHSVISRLGLIGVDVLMERAELVGHSNVYRGSFDVVTARAVGPLPVVLELTLPLCRVGGMVLAQRGSDGETGAGLFSGVAEGLGGGVPVSHPVEIPATTRRTSIVQVPKLKETISRYPRRTGIPAKRPLI